MIRAEAVLMLVVVAALAAGCFGVRCSPQPPAAVRIDDLYRRLARSAVSVSIQGEGSGSGTVVPAPLGLTRVLTCAHVVARQKASTAPIFILSINAKGEKTTEVARILRIDSAVDLALLEVKVGWWLPPLRLSAHDPETYEQLYSMASPDGLAGHPDAPRLAAIDVRPAWSKDSGITPAPTWRLSGMTLPGSSGGTVANAAGELVGVLQGWHEVDDEQRTKVAEIAYAVPRAAIERFLRECP